MRITRDNIKEGLYKRRFIFPNAVTLANMFCGFLSLIYSATGRYEKAAIAIGFAILLDGLDGRVARRLNATSKFGLEFDSLSDLVSFGIGPAIATYHWCFRTTADEFGVFVCFIYCLCTASRLARFNIAQSNPRGFTGLPSPGAAGMAAAAIYALPVPPEGLWFQALGTVLMLGLGFLMVSKVEYWKIKLQRLAGVHLVRMRLAGTVMLGSLIALIWYNTQIGFVVLALGYTLSGPLKLLLKKNSRRSGGGSGTASVINE